MSIFLIDIKKRAREIVRIAKPSPINVGLAFVLITFVISALSNNLLFVNFTESSYKQYVQHVAGGNYEYALLCLDKMMPPASAYPISLLLNLAGMIVEAGFIIFIMNTIRNAAACLGNLMDGFAIFGRVLLLYLLEGILIFLQMLLLVIPGIIAMYRYRLAVYLLIDHPEMSVTQCIRESSRMMKGHKGELFSLDISFIVWYVLNSMPVIGYASRVWSTPMIYTSRVLFYEALCGRDIYAPVNTLPRQRDDDDDRWEE